MRSNCCSGWLGSEFTKVAWPYPATKCDLPQLGTAYRGLRNANNYYCSHSYGDSLVFKHRFAMPKHYRK